MNHYTNLNIPSQAVQEIPIYLAPILYMISPMSAGTLIDILMNKLIGPQHCSFDNGEKNCTVYGIDMATWQRELLRILIQIIVSFLLIVFLQKYITKPLYLNLSLILFLLCQTYLFDDFRRLWAGIMFSLTHTERNSA
jgi:hypothetical protein